MAREPINPQWQAFMAPFFEGMGDHADRMMEELEPVFYLE
jgi:L-rhamnose mutarotase